MNSCISYTHASRFVAVNPCAELWRVNSGTKKPFPVPNVILHASRGRDLPIPLPLWKVSGTLMVLLTLLMTMVTAFIYLTLCTQTESFWVRQSHSNHVKWVNTILISHIEELRLRDSDLFKVAEMSRGFSRDLQGPNTSPPTLLNDTASRLTMACTEPERLIKDIVLHLCCLQYTDCSLCWNKMCLGS